MNNTTPQGQPEASSGLAVPTGSPLIRFIEECERDHFRTECDSGAHEKAMIVLNVARRHAGLPYLTKEDLPKWDGSKYVMPKDSHLLANTKIRGGEHRTPPAR